MTAQFANGRNRLDPSDWQININSGAGSLSPGTYYFSLQGRNRVGKNLLLIDGPYTIAQNDNIAIVINQSALKSGENWLFYTIGVSSSNVLDTFQQIARISLNDPILNTPLSFPLAITFDLDFQLIGGNIFTNITDLPTEGSGLRDGYLAGVSETALIYEYRSGDSSIADNNLVLTSTSGRWIARNTFSTFIENTSDDGGSRQDLSNITDESDVITQAYNPDGSQSDTVLLWLTNTTGSDIAAGTRIDFQVFFGNLEKSRLFSDRIFFTVLGFANLTTGELRTTQIDNTLLQITDLNAEIVYKFKQPSIVLGDRLQTNEAVAIQVRLAFISAGDVSGVVEQGTVRILPRFATTAGTFVALGRFFRRGVIFDDSTEDSNGNIVNPSQFRRIVPNQGLSVKALAGSGIINNLLFDRRPEQNIFDIQPNTAAQRLLINGNGRCYVNFTATDPADSQLRALIDTTAGTSQATAFTTPIAVGANGTITATFSHPIDNTTGKATIRSTYPDSSIANNSVGLLSANFVDIFIKNNDTGNIFTFTRPTVITSDTQSITFDAPSTIIGTTDPDFTTKFGFYDPISISIVSGTGGSWPAGNYSVSYRYNYNGQTVSNISHDPLLGCVREAIVSFDDLIENSQYWIAARTKESIRAISRANLRNGVEAKIIQDNGIPLSIVYDVTRTDADNDINIFAPNDAGTDPGRWIVPAAAELDIEDLIVEIAQEQVFIFRK